jgi:hypothetical protein
MIMAARETVFRGGAVSTAVQAATQAAAVAATTAAQAAATATTVATTAATTAANAATAATVAATAVAAAAQASNEVLSAHVTFISGRLDGMDVTLERVADSLTVLVRLEERQVALSKEVTSLVGDAKDEAGRLNSIEKQIGPLVEARRWVIAAALGIISLVGVSTFNALVTYQSRAEAAASASRVERVLAAPQDARKAIVDEAKK